MRQFKIVFLGDYKVGKTSLIDRFVNNEFSDLHSPTVGFNIFKKTLHLDNNTELNIAFWDTGGLFSQKSQTKEKIFRLVDGIIIVVDTTTKNKNLIVDRWYEYIQRSHENNVPIFIVYTKTDLNVEEVHIRKQSNDYSLPNYSVSARTGKNVAETFTEIINIVKDHYKKYSSEGINIQESKYKGFKLESNELKAIEKLEKFLIENSRNYKSPFNYYLNGLEQEGFPLLFRLDEDSFGITIENGYITGIGLFNCNLKALPNLFENFKSLKRLTLRCNPLSKLPDVVTNLRTIEYLDLALTDLSSIPEKIGNLNNLIQLNLENNKLVSLPDSLGSLHSLETLNLANNPLTSLPVSLCYLKNLSDLNLEAPSFFFKGDLKNLPDNFGNLISLQKLDLSSCNLTLLPKSIGKLEGIRILDLYDNNLISLPNSIGNLKLLEILNLEGNKLQVLPDSVGQLLNLKRINLKNNPLQKKSSDKFKALALKATGEKYRRLMKLSEICKVEEDSEKIIKKKPIRKKIGFIKSLIYASLIALIGTITFLNVNIESETSNWVIWLLFIGALVINLLIGACIIATLSRYFKITVRLFKLRIYKYFDIFVIIYLIWSIRAAIKILLSIELIPAINFVFEFPIPKSFLNLLVNVGYNLDLTFLENLDLFFGHFYLKIFSSALVFWALYRNGFKHIRKTAFEEKERKNIWVFLVIGLFGAITLAVMNYSNLKPYLSIGYDIGVIFGGWLFIWEKNLPKKSFFLSYLLLIFTGITLIWVISLWNMILSGISSIIFIVLYFIIRRMQNKKLSLYI
ncbi:MAG: GTP-binding protein [Candidatus Hodarchaeota archaeon]